LATSDHDWNDGCRVPVCVREHICWPGKLNKR
jgi:hypothetical protein